ncbi:Hypothetical Protein FCC1311_029132 [Hondaea fermentalgiana]|uniref:Major facilitator superfamily (MFS) profile domain-containing protein n=1 Tax=Hondaea fermentalgiana TaxID=2315210 RepID=A0A2R5G6L2_9STRA|nr:Hypothetical Protein FCC1311_029132 [Hondaea fermentalgiana]|eukprot:GBG26692.1 Hypothetical Protein FCC1311_029132 [Hondaea fermentalgiana]
MTFTCVDATTQAAHGYLIETNCDTYCLIAYGQNSYTSLFGYSYKVCQALGCAELDEDGNVVNDILDRLRTAASGTQNVYLCDNTTYLEYPDALQVPDPTTGPCNWYNPDIMEAVVPESDQTCTQLPLAFTTAGSSNWILNNLALFIGLVFLGIIVLIACMCGCWLRWRHNRGLNIYPSKAVELQPGKTFKHFVALMYLCFISIMTLAFINGMQAFLLADLYGVDSDDFGTVTGTLGVVDEIFSMIAVLAWGFVADRLGRRAMLTGGLSLVILSVILFPNGGSVYPGLLCARIIFAIGSSALTCSMTVILSDVVKRSSLGLGTGLIGVASGSGALFGVFVFMGPVATATCLEAAYYIFLIVPLTMLVATWVAVDNRPIVQAENSEEVEELEDTRPMMARLVELYHTSKKDPRLLVSYVSGFAARGATVVVTTYLPLWIALVYQEDGLCVASDSGDSSVCGELLENLSKQECPGAYTRASRVTGTAQAAGLIVAIWIGYYAGHFKNIYNALSFAGAFAGCAYLLTLVISEPAATSTYGIAFAWGIGEIGLVVVAQVAVARQMSFHPHQRGAIAGMYSFVGSLGIIFITYAGGILFDDWIPQAPFVLLGAFALFLSLLALWVSRWENKHGSVIVEAKDAVGTVNPISS